MVLLGVKMIQEPVIGIFSENIEIAHSSYVAKKERKAYFRKTLGSCDCKLLYNGSDDMLLSSSTGALKNRTLNLVTYSLLIDFINEFLKNGVTMRGFYSSHQSKSIMKYGVAESDVISWYAWHKACVEFMSNIFEINEREAFSCLTCGPRPPILVIDGISMGIQQSLKVNTGQIQTQMATPRSLAPNSRIECSSNFLQIGKFCARL